MKLLIYNNPKIEKSQKRQRFSLSGKILDTTGGILVAGSGFVLSSPGRGGGI